MIKVIIISGYGFNCEEETRFAFHLASKDIEIDIIHINDLISQPNLLSSYQIMCIPGGFSYGDHTGSGNAFACYLQHHLMDAISTFRQQDKLIMGICNGCQVLVRLFPEEFPVDLHTNVSGTYQCEWVDLITEKNNSIWCKDIKSMHIPIAHGEGRFVVHDDQSINIAWQYQQNPNGSDLNIAALESMDGKILAMMPHPERAVLFSQHDQWTFLKEKYKRQGQSPPIYADGIHIFRNAIAYFQ